MDDAVPWICDNGLGPFSAGTPECSSREVMIVVYKFP
jgi:hypothetical protein